MYLYFVCLFKNRNILKDCIPTININYIKEQNKKDGKGLLFSFLYIPWNSSIVFPTPLLQLSNASWGSYSSFQLNIYPPGVSIRSDKLKTSDSQNCFHISFQSQVPACHGSSE